MFRDGYRVSPYGDEQDDWLSLDRQALSSPGYKLNKLQFIGRVTVSRLLNPRLLDQTNREGLKDCPEKRVLVELLRYILQDLLKRHMDEVKRQQSAEELDIDLSELEKRMTGLQQRATRSIKALRQRHGDGVVEIRDIEQMFKEMQAAFETAVRATEIAQDEQARLLHLAGIGLMLEVVAHELARSTESALSTLAETRDQRLPEEVTGRLRTLRAELQTMNKRLRVLDPLSVPGRQRRETFDLIEVVKDSVTGRARQLDRHRVEAAVRTHGAGRLMVHGVRGMYVQIFENLLSNAIFWLGRRRADESDFVPKIFIDFDALGREVRFQDNGPGVSPDLKEEIFRAFFSTKDQRRRQGLGLYIARECAVHNGATLTLSGEHTEHHDRLNTFVLKLAEA